MPAPNITHNKAVTDRKVQGFFFLDYVRMLKHRPAIDWTKYLQPEDMVFLAQEINKTAWYPMGSFERMGLAILAEIAGGNMEQVQRWGRAQASELASRHSDIICEDQPRDSLVTFQLVRGSYFNFDPIHIQLLSPNYAKLEISYHMLPLAEQAACLQTLGYFERLLEISGAAAVDCRFTSKRWEGHPVTILEIDWSNITPKHKVKGLLFLDYVKLVKSRKDADWSRWLTPEDLEFINQKIDVNEWYPMSTFERMGAGIVNEIAKGDLNTVRVWGRAVVDSLILAHPDLISDGDPLETLYRFQVFRRGLFNFSAVDINAIHGNYAKLEIGYEMGRMTESAATHETVGFFEKLLETSGAQKLESRFLSKSWDGDPTTILELRWE